MNRHVSLTVGLFLASAALAADWPIFRGTATQTGVSAEALPAPLVERWKFRVGADKSGIASIESTAAIVNGVVFVGAFDDHVHALDLASGTEKWKLKTGPIKPTVSMSSVTVKKTGPSLSTPSARRGPCRRPAR